MSKNNPHHRAPVYTFQGRSSAEEYLEVARIYHKEAKQLFARAQEALAEDRQEEAKLLIHLATAQRDRADEFEKAAREEGRDPIVTELLNNEKSMRKNYTPYTPTYIAPDADLPKAGKMN